MPNNPNILRSLLITVAICMCQLSYGQYTEIQGRVIDSQADSTNRPVPYASINLKGTTASTVGDSDGFFFIRTKEKSDSIVISFTSRRVVLPIKRGATQRMTIDLATGQEIKDRLIYVK